MTDLVIKACLKNEADDPQCEGSRADFLMSFYDSDHDRNSIRQAVFEALAAASNHSWHNYQLAEFAVCLWEDGDTEARDMVHQFFSQTPIDNTGKDVDGFIIYMDGFDGLVNVARKYGRDILENGSELQHRKIESFTEQHPDVNAQARLEELAETEPEIAAYLEGERRRLTRSAARSQKKDSESLSAYELVKQDIGSTGRVYVRGSKISKLSKPDLHRLALELLAEDEPLRVRKYLMIFGQRPFPFAHSDLLQILDRFPESDYVVVPIGARMLGKISAVAIRDFALEKLRGSCPHHYMGMLVRNYMPGDEAIMLDLLNRRIDYKQIHWLAESILDIYEANPSPLCEKPLTLIYEKMNCSIHRMAVVKMLIAQHVLSDKIRSELPFDCDKDIRKLADVVS